MIAGFDPSLTHLGWVLFDENKIGKNSVLDSGVFKTDTKDGSWTQRLIIQRERVYNFLIANNIKFIAAEAPYWGDHSTEILYALNQFLHEVYLNLKVYIVYFQPNVLKRFAYPEANIKIQDLTKHHMTHKAKSELEKHGRRFSEHQADAYFAGKLGHLYYRWNFKKELKDEDLPENEKELFCGKHTFIKGPRKGITEYTGIIYRENDQFFDYTKGQKNTEMIKKEILNGTIKN